MANIDLSRVDSSGTYSLFSFPNPLLQASLKFSLIASPKGPELPQDQAV